MMLPLQSANLVCKKQKIAAQIIKKKLLRRKKDKNLERKRKINVSRQHETTNERKRERNKEEEALTNTKDDLLVSGNDGGSKTKDHANEGNETPPG